MCKFHSIFLFSMHITIATSISAYQALGTGGGGGDGREPGPYCEQK